MIFTTHKNIKILVDFGDFDRISNHKWHRTQSGHFYTSIKSQSVFIHNFILNRKPNQFLVVDHINQDPSDNRKINLRIVSKSINALNKGSFRGVSKFKGVAKGRGNNYRAYITYNKKRISLETYETELDAARAYNVFALKYIKTPIALNNTGDDYSFFIPLPTSTDITSSDLDLDKNIHRRPSGSYRYAFSFEGREYKSPTYKTINEVYAFRFLLLYSVSTMQCNMEMLKCSDMKVSQTFLAA